MIKKCLLLCSCMFLLSGCANFSPNNSVTDSSIDNSSIITTSTSTDTSSTIDSSTNINTQTGSSSIAVSELLKPVVVNINLDTFYDIDEDLNDFICNDFEDYVSAHIKYITIDDIICEINKTSFSDIQDLSKYADLESLEFFNNTANTLENFYVTLNLSKSISIVLRFRSNSTINDAILYSFTILHDIANVEDDNEKCFSKFSCVIPLSIDCETFVNKISNIPCNTTGTNNDYSYFTYKNSEGFEDTSGFSIKIGFDRFYNKIVYLLYEVDAK